MPDWLNPIRDVLDHASNPIEIFFRDDDAGWENDRLYALLDEFAKAGIPIDLAVIPNALDDGLSTELLTRWRQNDHPLGLHQHGYSHTNHEVEGRKCEFGISRTKSQQKDDIAAGQKILSNYLGAALDPFFTPPWNRCNPATAECLEELGFKLLSRDVTATSFTDLAIKQVPVHVDWSKLIKASSQTLPDLAGAITKNLVSNKLTGIMLHHADMDMVQLEPLAELLAVFADHENADVRLLRDTQ